MAKSLSIPRNETMSPSRDSTATNGLGPLSSSRLPPVKSRPMSPITTENEEPFSTSGDVNLRPTCTANFSVECSCSKCDSIRALQDELQFARLEISRLQNRLRQSADPRMPSCPSSSSQPLDPSMLNACNVTEPCFCSTCRHVANSMVLMQDNETTF